LGNNRVGLAVANEWFLAVPAIFSARLTSALFAAKNKYWYNSSHFLNVFILCDQFLLQFNQVCCTCYAGLMKWATFDYDLNIFDLI
jgi:hypothetical protein